jgi:hypothetical protein
LYHILVLVSSHQKVKDVHAEASYTVKNKDVLNYPFLEESTARNIDQARCVRQKTARSPLKEILTSVRHMEEVKDANQIAVIS